MTPTQGAPPYFKCCAKYLFISNIVTLSFPKIGLSLTSSPQASGWLTPAAGWAMVNEGRTFGWRAPWPTSCCRICRAICRRS